MKTTLRTDLTVTHASGGSGAPSLEMMRLRGASMARYLQHTRRAGYAEVVARLLGAGYVARALSQRVLGHPVRAGEHWAYARGAFTAQAWVGGQEVTNRA